MAEKPFSQDRLSNLLGICIVPAVLEYAQIPDDGIDAFYHSKLYELLGNAETGMWHFSPRTLADMYLEELKTGTFEIPEACA